MDKQWFVRADNMSSGVYVSAPTRKAAIQIILNGDMNKIKLNGHHNLGEAHLLPGFLMRVRRITT